MSYEQNEWIVEWDDANAPADEPEKLQDPFDAALERYYEKEQAIEREQAIRNANIIRNAHTSWRKTTGILDAICPEWRAV